uniref:Uncharacterized protein n=1 Tax=Avena sativa TaxID=4498 RepID=A0ACD5VZE5_AVESA
MAYFISLLLVVTAAAVIGTARGEDPLTVGFTPVRLTESQFVVQKPFNVPLNERYEFAGGVRRMWVYSTDKPISSTHRGGARTEIKINEIYRSGVWQFEGEVYVPAGTTGASVMQIFGAAPAQQATTLMLHVYDGNLTFYHDLRRVLAENIYDRWIRLNVIHDVADRSIVVYVDGDERLRYRGPGSSSAPHYFKFGVYKQSHHQPSYLMESRWRNVAVFTKP